MTKNIKVHEIECGCGCGFNKMSRGTLNIVQMVRDVFGKPVRINDGGHCGCRCEEHNAKVGGSKNSQHKPQDDGMAHAIDFHVEGVEPKVVYEFLNKLFPNSLGLGLYNTFVHIDDRCDKAYRWNG